MHMVADQQSSFVINQHLPFMVQKIVEMAIYFACLSKLEVTYFTLVLPP